MAKRAAAAHRPCCKAAVGPAVARLAGKSHLRHGRLGFGCFLRGFESRWASEAAFRSLLEPESRCEEHLVRPERPSVLRRPMSGTMLSSRKRFSQPCLAIAPILGPFRSIDCCSNGSGACKFKPRSCFSKVFRGFSCLPQFTCHSSSNGGACLSSVAKKARLKPVTRSS